MRQRALVFDSGVGGLSVLDAIVAAGLDLDLDYLADNAWLPYGEKSEAALVARVPGLVSAVAEQTGADAIVVACNTASTIALEATRSAQARPVIGVVPPIKPAAAMTKTGAIALLATPATIKRAYTDDLIARFAADRRVVRVGSTALVAAAEAKLRGEAPDVAAIAEAIAPIFEVGDVDVVALACTHFPLLRDELAAAAPRPVAWLDSGAAIAARLATVLNLERGAGAARLRRAGFTAPNAARAAWSAFEARGFSVAAAVGPEPSFELSPTAEARLG